MPTSYISCNKYPFLNIRAPKIYTIKTVGGKEKNQKEGLNYYIIIYISFITIKNL